jgi:hypothetical protein
MSPSIEFLADAETRLLCGIRSRTATELLGFLGRFADAGACRAGADTDHVATSSADGWVSRLAGAVDALLRVRATEDAGYFQRLCARAFDRAQLDAIAAALLHDYRQRCATARAGATQ